MPLKNPDRFIDNLGDKTMTSPAQVPKIAKPPKAPKPPKHQKPFKEVHVFTEGTSAWNYRSVLCHCGATVTTWENPKAHVKHHWWPLRRVCSMCLAREFPTRIVSRPL